MNKQLYKILFHAKLDKFTHYNCEIIVSDTIENAYQIGLFLCKKQYPELNQFIDHQVAVTLLSDKELFDISEFINNEVIEDDEVTLDLDVWGELFLEK